MDFTAVRRLLDKLFPDKSASFLLEAIDPVDGQDCFEIEQRGDKIHLRGNNPVSVAAALGHYLKHDCRIRQLWCGTDPITLTALPTATPYRHVIPQKYRVYMNYCTFNYSASWWTWERWEQEIDRMALYGINMPLAAVGIENVWHEMLLEVGMAEEDVLAFLAGPAFLAWQWMTNLEGFCGPMPRGWLRRRKELAVRIITRMREYGMMPIQQGFSGAVPAKIRDLFPKSRIRQQGKWCGIDGAWQLDPTDPLFDRLGMLFLEKQRQLFGSYGYYAADPFHEGEPPVKGAEYLQDVGQRIARLMRRFDDNAVWVMQAWSIRKDIACQVDRERLLILDLNSQQFATKENFWGYPFVAGTLHNFGGRTRLHGDLRRQADNPFLLAQQQAPNVCGSGLFMEAIEQNPLFYTLAFEQLISDRTVDLDEWLTEYAHIRYQTQDEKAVAATKEWTRLLYQPQTDEPEASSMFAARPAIDRIKSGPNRDFCIPYSVAELAEAYRLLADSDAHSDGYNYDRVDLLRQLLSDYGYHLQRSVIAAYKAENLSDFDDVSQQFMELLADADRLLSSRSEFRLDRWTESARAFGDTQEEKAYYEHNAKVLITLWGPEQKSDIFDYSWREWSGLIGEFYAMRWEAFFGFLRNNLVTHQAYDESTVPTTFDRPSWRGNPFYDGLADREVAWTHSRSVPCADTPDAIATADAVFEKYASRFAAITTTV